MLLGAAHNHLAAAAGAGDAMGVADAGIAAAFLEVCRAGCDEKASAEDAPVRVKLQLLAEALQAEATAAAMAGAVRRPACARALSFARGRSRAALCTSQPALSFAVL